ncbi:hypothetical protein [Microbacterium sp.]|uniref:hypothetical protein n=1 Tax=Microbacterium sp. TaxID=51671 RepID=UPI003F9D3D5B
MSASESIQDRLAAILAEDPAVWQIADETDTVRLSVDADGALHTLHLTPSWWRRVTPEELGPLVFRLRHASAASRLHTIAELEEEGLRRTDTDVKEVPPLPNSDADSLDISRLATELGDVLSAFSELDRYRKAVRSSTSESAELRSASGNVTLELVGGSPRRLVVDKMNVQLVSESEIAAEIIELFNRARGWFGERRAALMNELPALAGVVRAVRSA